MGGQTRETAVHAGPSAASPHPDGAVQPAPAQTRADGDEAEPFVDGCPASFAATIPGHCTHGAAAGATTAVLCGELRVAALARIAELHPQLVVLGMNRADGSAHHLDQHGPAWDQGLAATIAASHADNAQALVLGPVPHPANNEPAAGRNTCARSSRTKPRSTCCASCRHLSTAPPPQRRIEYHRATGDHLDLPPLRAPPAAGV